jgi:hypothetical protein
MNKIPKKIYRYLYFSDSDERNNQIEKFVMTGRLPLSDPRKFNDPFDCASGIDPHSYTPEEKER